MTKREQLILWLGDAHALEVGIVTTLEKHLADAKGLPEVQSVLKRHLAETKRHASEVKKALAALGGSHPVVREGISKLVNTVAGLATSVARDTVVKNALADYATEHFEIACYRSLIVTATEVGETKVAATCEAILKDEEAMAAALEAQLPALNRAYLATLESEDADAATRKAAGESPTPKKRATARRSAKSANADKSTPAKAARKTPVRRKTKARK